MIFHESRRVRSPLMALAALLLKAPAHAANPAIYKCFDRHLALVYTDIPCKDGEQLDVRPGDADPAAMARLDPAGDPAAQSSARRISDLRAAQLSRTYAAAEDYAPAFNAGSYAEPLDYAPYGYEYA